MTTKNLETLPPGLRRLHEADSDPQEQFEHSRRELADLRARIREIVSGLPVEQRRAFVLALADGRTCAQVGDRLGVGYGDGVRVVEQLRNELREGLTGGDS